PHQLYADHPALAPGRPVYLIEDPLYLGEWPTHRQRALLHRLSMQVYAKRLEAAGHRVKTLSGLNASGEAIARIAQDGVDALHIADTTDTWLERRLKKAATRHQMTLHRYPSRLFMLSMEAAVARYESSGRYMAKFYRKLREDTGILLTGDGGPVGGKWSFDAENRKKLPKSVTLPADIVAYGNGETTAAVDWLGSLKGEFYGDAQVWLPYTHEGAAAWLESFLKDRFGDFGTYEDALTTRSVRVFHSTLSPLMNIGLLTPRQVVERTLEYAAAHKVAINNTEGFIRQVIGWREFIRAAYETEGTAMRRANFWTFDAQLPEGVWTGETGVEPVDLVIRGALKWGYSHHIERLMVMGNWMLLMRIHPDAVYRWFMGMYVDAYDWVMVPNVYGMSQFADGGSFATKPYISGANYLKKMSDYAGGTWEKDFTALYWAFIRDHRGVFEGNYRLSMMPRTLDKMKRETRDAHMERAASLLP
ncbi:MAG: cryptochrome/photolyase family protein, partial [Pseudomonadota bacterium]